MCPRLEKPGRDIMIRFVGLIYITQREDGKKGWVGWQRYWFRTEMRIYGRDHKGRKKLKFSIFNLKFYFTYHQSWLGHVQAWLNSTERNLRL